MLSMTGFGRGCAEAAEAGLADGTGLGFDGEEGP